MRSEVEVDITDRFGSEGRICRARRQRNWNMVIMLMLRISYHRSDADPAQIH
jgi:hypothetical protein